MLSRRTFLCASSSAACAARIGNWRALPRPARTDFRVLTLNVAHGRGRALMQSRARSTDWYRSNLDAVAQLVAREQPDAVALQEIEFGSRWAGGFDHLGHFARRSNYRIAARTAHMATDHLSYGTAVVARDHPIVAGGHTFARSGPWRKGLSWAHLPLGGHEITVLSVHLDPGNPATRLAQAQEIERCIDGPAIVMGDFNTDVSPVRTTAIDRLLHGVGLHTKQPALNTFPLLGRTLDWILVPPSLEILQVAALRDRVSDHRAVLADLRWIRPPAQPLAPPRC